MFPPAPGAPWGASGPERSVASATIMAAARTGVQPPNAHPFSRRSDADVLVPELGPGANELRHHTETLRVVEHVQGHAARAEVSFGALKRPVLTDDDPGDLVQEHRPAAHVAGGQGRIEHGAP